MKRKYIIEASVAVLVIITLYVFMIPRFQKVQVTGKPEEVQNYVNAVLNYLVDNQDVLSSLGNTISLGTTLPYKNTIKMKQVNLYLQTVYRFSEKESFFAKFPNIQPPDWVGNELIFVVNDTYPLNSTKFLNPGNLDSAFDDAPIKIAVMAIVGDKREMGRWQVNGELYYGFVDDDGDLVFRNTYTPFDISNGISSYGGFYADTSSIWPKKKAVIMNPPPVGE